MSVLVLILAVVALGIAAFFVPKIPFIHETFKTIIVWVLIGVAVILVLEALGVFSLLGGMNVRIFGRQ